MTDLAANVRSSLQLLAVATGLSAFALGCGSSSTTGGGTQSGSDSGTGVVTSNPGGDASTGAGSTDAGSDGSTGGDATCTDVCSNFQKACPSEYSADCVTQCQAGTTAQKNCAATATTCAAIEACQSTDQVPFRGACSCGALNGSPGSCASNCANPNGDYACYNTSQGGTDLICTEPCNTNDNNCPASSTCGKILDTSFNVVGYLCLPN
jgi:hypothetical protein